MAGFRIREGKVTAVIGDELERFVRGAVSAALPGVLEAMEREGNRVRDEARLEWPVRTGVSRDGLLVATTYDIGRKEVSVAVRNDVPYAIYVRYEQSTAWTKLVRGPMEVGRKRVADELGDVILSAVRKAA